MGGKMLLNILIMLALQGQCLSFPENERENMFPKPMKPSDSQVFTLVVAYMSDAVLPCYSPELDVASVFRYWWYKNGQEIGRTDRKPAPVIQTGDGALWLQNATTEDNGIYSCHVYTDVGTKEINVTLIVLDAEKAPHFSNASFPSTPSRRKIGSSVEFRCPVDGVPTPRLEWYKNEVLITKTVAPTTIIEAEKWSLLMKNLTIEDSGNYTCVAINRLGTVNGTFALIVHDGTQPDLALFHPLNTTVKYGSSATFQCRVRSDFAPSIQWLKRVDNKSEHKSDHKILKVHGENYRLLQSSQEERSDGSYLNKLEISEARENDTGKYICLGANKMGYSFRSAYLTVMPRPRSVTGWSHHISMHPRDSGNFQVAFPTVGGGLGIALAMAVVGAFYFVCRRRSRGNFDSSMQSGAFRTRPTIANFLPSTSIELDSMSKARSSLSKSSLISNTSPAMSEVELAGGGMTVTKLYDTGENSESCYKLRDEV